MPPSRPELVLTEKQRSKENDRPDRAFYREPRLVQHVDERFRERLTELYREHLSPGADVLDLMSSWVSHLPEDVELGRVVGHGMNEEGWEMGRNEPPRLCRSVFSWFEQHARAGGMSFGSLSLSRRAVSSKAGTERSVPELRLTSRLAFPSANPTVPKRPAPGENSETRTGLGQFAAPCDRSFSRGGTPGQATGGLPARVRSPSGGIALLKSVHALIGANDDEPVALLKRKRVWIERRNRVALPLHRHYGASRFRTDVGQGDTAEVLRTFGAKARHEILGTDCWGRSRN